MLLQSLHACPKSTAGVDRKGKTTAQIDDAYIKKQTKNFPPLLFYSAVNSWVIKE